MSGCLLVTWHSSASGRAHAWGDVCLRGGLRGRAGRDGRDLFGGGGGDVVFDVLGVPRRQALARHHALACWMCGGVLSSLSLAPLLPAWHDLLPPVPRCLAPFLPCACGGGVRSEIAPHPQAGLGVELGVGCSLPAPAS